MKKLIVLLVLITISCVQKTYKKTVVVTLDVSGIENIKSVGIRGKDQPLNWESDYKMEVVKKDSLYKATITGETAYLFSEIKFTINDKFELKDKENRKVFFFKTDTTFYKAKFDKLHK
jgi:hypothetical protein